MKRRAVWISVGAAVALVLAAGAVWLLLPRADSAEAQALAYLHALEDGDVAGVEAVGIAVPATAAAAFTAASEHLSKVATTSSAESDSSATVQITYVLAGERHEAELTMARENGRWVPAAETAFGTATTDASAAIGEAVLDADAATALLPAGYDVVSSPTAFLAGVTTTIQVAPGSAQEVSMEGTTLRPEATALAQEQLDEYLTACTRPSAQVPPSCGIIVPWAADFVDVSNISYRIEKTPALSITATSFHAADGILVATVTGTSIDGVSTTNLSYRTSNWMLRGDVSFTADDIVLSVW